jgi:hypothetical protein
VVREGKLNTKDIQGLTEDKLAYIRREATRPPAWDCGKPQACGHSFNV